MTDRAVQGVNESRDLRAIVGAPRDAHHLACKTSTGPRGQCLRAPEPHRGGGASPGPSFCEEGGAVGRSRQAVPSLDRQRNRQTRDGGTSVHIKDMHARESAHIGLRAKTTLDESPEAMRQVRLAIARAKEGDREALRLLYVRYSDNVYGYVRSIVRDEKEAEDLTQHVFLKLITVIGKYEI